MPDSDPETQIPSDVTCPVCGGDPRDETPHNLNDLGYHAVDVGFECRDCGYTWASGVPVGEYEGDAAGDLLCGACTERYGLVYQVTRRPDENAVDLGVKCPHCYHKWHVRREAAPGGTTLVGYPQVTGSTDGTR